MGSDPTGLKSTQSSGPVVITVDTNAVVVYYIMLCRNLVWFQKHKPTYQAEEGFGNSIEKRESEKVVL